MVGSSRIIRRHTVLLKIAEHLLKHTEKLATAESCTGGLVSKMLTDVAGSSGWYEAGVISYSNHSKVEMLGVANNLIKQYGAVSLPVAQAMAEGALNKLHAEWSVAITGIAGPGGGSLDKPVGTVCFAWAYAMQQMCKTETKQFTGDREAIRQQAAEYALQQLLVLMERVT